MTSSIIPRENGETNYIQELYLWLQECWLLKHFVCLGDLSSGLGGVMLRSQRIFAPIRFASTLGSIPMPRFSQRPFASHSRNLQLGLGGVAIGPYRLPFGAPMHCGCARLGTLTLAIAEHSVGYIRLLLYLVCTLVLRF